MVMLSYYHRAYRAYPACRRSRTDLRPVPTFRAVTVVVTASGPEAERHITHTPTVRGRGPATNVA